MRCGPLPPTPSLKGRGHIHRATAARFHSGRVGPRPVATRNDRQAPLGAVREPSNQLEAGHSSLCHGRPGLDPGRPATTTLLLAARKDVGGRAIPGSSPGTAMTQGFATRLIEAVISRRPLRSCLGATQAAPRQSHGSTTTRGQIACARRALLPCDAALSSAWFGRITMANRSSRPNGATTSRPSSSSRPLSSSRTPTACTIDA